MAIGVRITSSNLNGKTATVTFVPAAGSPDGTGSVNLGTQTIPFNNIDTFPYGTYSLNFAEYNYTYTLEIPVPVEGVQSFTTVAPTIGSEGNYGSAFLNFNDLTAEIIDLGVSANDWWAWNVYPLQKGGYAYHFVGYDNWSQRRVIFTDKNGTIIGDYSNLNSGWDIDDLDGKINIVNNYQIGEVYYSDGVEVYTYTYNPAIYEFDFDWNNYATTKDGSMIFYMFNNNTLEVKVYNVLGNTVTEINSFYAPSGVNMDFNLTPSHTFYPCLSSEYGTYLDIKFRNTSGTQIGLSVDLSDLVYNNYNWETYGDNRFVAVFWNSGNASIPYRIVHFDGNTHTTTTTTHERGANYNNIEIIADDTFYSNNCAPTSAIVSFYSVVDYSNMGIQSNYYDIVYMLGNQDTLSTYIIANNSNKTIAYPIAGPDRIDVLYINGNEEVTRLITIIDGDDFAVSTGVVGNTNDSVYRWNINGLGLVAMIVDPNNTTGNIINSRTVGVIDHSIAFTWPSPWYGSYQATNGIFYMGNYTDTVYINKTSNGFQTLNSSYTWYYTPDTYQTSTGLENDILVIVNPDTWHARSITGTSISNDITLPTHDGTWSLDIGKNNIMYVYNNPSNDHLTTINLYNRNFTLVNSAVTQYSAEWNSWSVEDRYVISYTTGSGRVITYLVSPTTILNTIQYSYQYYTTPNDIAYWWD